jgi:hypothetical protein
MPSFLKDIPSDLPPENPEENALSSAVVSIRKKDHEDPLSNTKNTT